MLTMEERDAIRARCEAATPGPWFVREGKSFGVQSEGLNIASCFRRANEDFIAHARQDVPALLDALDEANAAYEALNGRLKKHLEENHGCENCYGRTGWCELPNIEERCGKALATDRDRWKWLAESILAESERWKSRCEALERALTHYVEQNGCMENWCANKGSSCETCNMSRWEFDESKFSEDCP